MKSSPFGVPSAADAATQSSAGALAGCREGVPPSLRRAATSRTQFRNGTARKPCPVKPLPSASYFLIVYVPEQSHVAPPAPSPLPAQVPSPLRPANFPVPPAIIHLFPPDTN
jgi:hypothetical protein